MISVNDLRAGNVYIYDGKHYMVLDTSLNKTAMRKMVVKIKSKNVHSGAITELSFNGGEKVEPAHLDKRQMQYLYDAGEGLIFMDQENYEQIEISKKRLEWEINFLKENEIIDVVLLEGEVIGVNLPAKVELEIIQTEPAIRGDTVNKAMKDAVVSTGLKVRVPLFVSEGERIIVRTDNGQYDGRA